MGTISNSSKSNDPLHFIASEILRHPQFDAGLPRYVEDSIRFRRRLGLFNRVGTNIFLHVAHYAIYLHFSNRLGLDNEGATFTRLADICKARRQCGARALRTILLIMQAMGYFVVERSAKDGRVQVYVPTEKMLVDVADQSVRPFSILDRIVPNANSEAEITSNRDFLAQVMVYSGRAVIEEGVQIIEPEEDLDAIFSQAGGIATSLMILQSILSGAPMPSQRTIARSFSLSESQVRNNMKALTSRNMIRTSETGELLDAGALVSAFKAVIAREVGLHAKYGLGLEEYFSGTTSLENSR